jgi:F0F1-type ATP synthase membrane subunit b/b'
MKELVFDLITSYENRITTVQDLIGTAYQAAATSEQSLTNLDKERERLKAGLQRILAKNCSLRKKDFNDLMQRILADSEIKRKEIEREQECARQKVSEYLREQKELAISIRQQLVERAGDNAGKDDLEAVLGRIRATYQGMSQQLFATLRKFQSRLQAFQGEQEEMNHRLQRLLDRGESLRIEGTCGEKKWKGC